jgi:hypothetical protein
VSYEGRPADYQVARIDSLKKELGDVEAEFDVLVAKEPPSINKDLAKRSYRPSNRSRVKIRAPPIAETIPPQPNPVPKHSGSATDPLQSLEGRGRPLSPMPPGFHEQVRVLLTGVAQEGHETEIHV